MEAPRADESPGRIRPGTRILLALGALLVIFGAVLAVELATGERTPVPGAELLAAPDPLIPGTVAGYSIRAEPDLASALTAEYRSRSVSIERVEAASIPLRSSASSLLAATMKPEADLASSQFRAGVLTGAASGFGIDPAANPFRYRTAGGVVVYSTDAPEGALFVWFFRDAFVQLFVPAELSTEAQEIQRVVLEAQLVQVDAARR